MSTQREIIYKELLVRYRKDKIREYLYKKEKEKDLTIERKQKLELKVDELWRDNLKNPDLLKEICGFVIVEYSDTYDIALFNKIKNEVKKSTKTFHIVEIERIHSDMVTNFSFGVSLDKKGKMTTLKISDSTGLFKLVFSDGSFMYYSKWISGGGKAKAVEGMYAAEREVWLKFLGMMKAERRKTAKPKNGIFKIRNDGNGGIVYDKLISLQETPIIHPSTDTLLEDITFYFSDVAFYTRYGMSGVRKTLMVGPPGTGKSSLAVKVAKKFSVDKCIVFSTNIADIAMHLMLCAKYKTSTIGVLEDAEATLSNANSSLLNFLDGVDQPKNLQGSYVIMTTNFPERIESRILKRPGRIDRIIEFGNLTGKYAIKCAEIYFEGILFNNKNTSNTKEGKLLRKELYPIINKASGAEIKELAQSSASYAASNRKDVDIELIKTVQIRMKDDLKNIFKYAEESSSISNPKKKSVGFSQDDDFFKSDFDEKCLQPVEAL